MQSLHLVSNNVMQLYHLGANWLEKSFAEMDLRVLLHKNLNVIQQSALTAKKTNYLLGCTSKGAARSSGEVILPLYLTSIVRSHLE